MAHEFLHGHFWVDESAGIWSKLANLAGISLYEPKRKPLPPRFVIHEMRSCSVTLSFRCNVYRLYRLANQPFSSPPMTKRWRSLKTVSWYLDTEPVRHFRQTSCNCWSVNLPIDFAALTGVFDVFGVEVGHNSVFDS